MDYIITRYVVMECFIWCTSNGGGETLFIDVSVDERCAPEWCSFMSLDPPDLVTSEELIGAYHIEPAFILIK